jgi:membrane protease YdiL (CAAX protease family)
LLFFIPLLILRIKKQSLQEFSIVPENPAFSLDLGLKGYLVSFLPWIIGFGIITWIGSAYDRFIGSIILSASYIGAASLLMVITRNISVETSYPNGFAKKQVFTYIAILIFPLILAIITQRSFFPVISTLVWQLVFSGFGEEFYWRGYFQGRLNQVFEKKFQFLGVRFGLGLIMTSVLFGISHGLNTVNLLGGKSHFGIWWAIWTCFSGFFLGLIREKSEGILAPALVHGTVDAVGESLAVIFGIFG